MKCRKAAKKHKNYAEFWQLYGSRVQLPGKRQVKVEMDYFEVHG